MSSDRGRVKIPYLQNQATGDGEIATPARGLARNDRMGTEKRDGEPVPYGFAMTGQGKEAERMALQWFELKAEGYGTITIKARYLWEAVREAAERLGCDEDEVVCVGYRPFYSRSVFS